MNQINIKGRLISSRQSPFIIAEMSGNHNQSLDRALAIVEAAASAGADAIKLQTYTPDTMTVNAKGGLFSIDDESSLWKGRNLYDLYKEAYTPWEWHKPLFKRAQELGLFIFSTPFDETAVDFLESLDVGAYKIASFENCDWPLLKKVASMGKPVIMSTGAVALSDLCDSVKLLKDSGCKDLILLKCTSTYPASPLNTDLNTIPHMRELFDCPIGLSDHTLGIGVSIASVALGACVIEKHFTLNRADGGVDSAFSIEPSELKLLVDESKRAFDALGMVKYGIQETEKTGLRFKRSIYAVKNIREGDLFTADNVRVIRPGDGLSPKYYEMIINKKSNKNIPENTPLTWDSIL